MTLEENIFDKMCQRIAFTTSNASLRKALRQIYPRAREDGKTVGWTTLFFKDKIGDLDKEDDIVGWTIALLKDYLPDIEVYVDEICRTVALHMDLIGKNDEDEYIKFVIRMLNEVFVHELIHELGFIINEEEVQDYTTALFEAMKMVWHYIPCPNTNELVTWDVCLACNDFDKHETCPLQRIRKDAIPRQYEQKKYHVSELLKARYSFYERRQKTIAGWSEYWPMFWGRAIGWYVASLYEEKSREFELNVAAKDLAEFYGVPVEPTDDFTITGHIDILPYEDGLSLELKCQYNLKYVTDAPNPHHVAQVQAYWVLGQIQFPEIFSKVKQLRITYYGRNWKGASVPPYKEHVVPMEKIDLLTPARWMRESEDTNKPPAIYCPDWLCRICPHKSLCREDGSG